MKLAGLMPQCGRTPKPSSLLCLDRLTDEPIRFIDHEPVWNDYGNRLVLLAMAARKNCDWVLWLDDDETLPINTTRADIEGEILNAFSRGAIAVTFQRCDMWNQTHWRSDGIWRKKRKVVLQRNPLMEEFVHWRGSHLQPLHAMPLQIGDTIDSHLRIFHWGWNTTEARKAAVERYKSIDPQNRYQPEGYDYILDETGIELAALK